MKAAKKQKLADSPKALAESPERAANTGLLSQSYELVPIATLRPHPKNPRKGNLQVIEQSISANGFYGAVVAQKSTRCILAGAHRWKSAQASGLANVPVIWLDVDDATALRIMSADNRTSDLAKYDDRALAELLDSIRKETGGFDGSGYNDSDLDEILSSASSQHEQWISSLRPANSCKTDEKETPNKKKQLGDDLKERFEILITCSSELQQAELLQRFETEGLQCRALLS